jgi:O-antigen/teichoic acid export membrane protein
MVATLVFTPLLLHSMGVSNFGLWMLGTSFLGLLGVFDLGLSTAIAKHIAQYSEQEDRYRLSTTATMGLLIYLTIGLVLTVPTYLLAPHAAKLFPSHGVPPDTIAEVMRLASFGFVPLLLKNAGLAVPMGLQRFRAPMVISVVQSVLTLSLAFAVTRRGGSVTDVVVSSLISLWVTALASLVIGYRMLHTLGARVLFSRAQAQLILRYSAFTSVSGLGSLLFTTVDRITVGIVLGVSAVAYYVVGVGIATYLLTVTSVVTHPLMPAASSWSSSGQWERVRKLLVRSTRAIAVMELVLASSLLLISRPFLIVWLGPDVAAHALTPFRILVLVYAIVCLNAPGHHIANGSGFPWIPALGGLAGGLLTIMLIIPLGRSWGLAGAAWANTGYWVTLLIPALTAHSLRRRITKRSVLNVRPESTEHSH